MVSSQSTWQSRRSALETRAARSYGAIVVDEAQDFDADWWLPLQLLLESPDTSPLYVFGKIVRSSIHRFKDHGYSFADGHDLGPGAVLDSLA